ncbi:MAG TPA: peptidylprolyl isomerase, partial [Candidatus Competibacteraceae bacterium]|nr:peptidylprolyl isomerase [Candidatus Competibacteraceae bacterium]
MNAPATEIALRTTVMKTAARILTLCLALSGPALACAQDLIFGPGPSAAPSSRGSAADLDAIVAVVNDDVITRRELDAALANVQRQLRERGVQAPPAAALENQVLERLIMNQLQLRAAEKSGVTVDDQTLNAAMEAIAQRNNLSLSQLRATLEKDGYSFASFREDIRRELLATRLRQRVVEGKLSVSEQELDTFLASAQGQVQGREFHLAQILIAVPEGASAQQLEQAQAKARQVLERLHQGADFKRLASSVSDGREALEGGDLGWRALDRIPSLFLPVVRTLKPGEVSDIVRSPRGFHIIKLLEERATSASAAPVTQSHVRHILVRTGSGISDEQARQKLERLRERAQNGEDFAALARANSEDSASAERGGDLGWIGPGTLPPPVEQELAGLQPGQVSAPFQSADGWHIVQVLERRQQAGGDSATRAAAREALLR